VYNIAFDRDVMAFVLCF